MYRTTVKKIFYKLIIISQIDNNATFYFLTTEPHTVYIVYTCAIHTNFQLTKQRTQIRSEERRNGDILIDIYLREKQLQIKENIMKHGIS